MIVHVLAVVMALRLLALCRVGDEFSMYRTGLRTASGRFDDVGRPTAATKCASSDLYGQAHEFVTA